MNDSTLKNPSLTVLSRLLLAPPPLSAHEVEIAADKREEILTIANDHHVIVRGLESYRKIAESENLPESASWASRAVERERERINLAVSFLDRICRALDTAGCKAMVIKSLDHWPDLGSDLDLYTDAEPTRVISAMRKHFDASVSARSWGDRLANKWNFEIPGLPEAVEIHMGRLGQTGEQASIAANLIAHSRQVEVAGRQFPVASPEHRLMICTLQRMYRHFYARLCDILDTDILLHSGIVDFVNLRSYATEAGIWRGVATFLKIVCDYVEHYRGTAFHLPGFVLEEAAFGADEIRFEKGFLRIPILPHSAKLYTAEWAALLQRGQLASTARLTLLPCLASAAALGYKITGSDKGIW